MEVSIPVVSEVRGVGIDVAKKTLSICMKHADGSEEVHAPDNTDADISKWISDSLGGYSGKIVLESTGTFHQLPAVLLTEAGYDVRVINPLIAKKYTTSRIRKVKTDKADASVLAEISMKEERLPATFSDSRKTLSCKRKLTFLSSLERKLCEISMVIRGLEETEETLSVASSGTIASMNLLVKQLEKEKRRLELELTREIVSSASEKERETIALLDGVPGISTLTAAVVATMFTPPGQSSPRQWIAYVGLDVSVRESGAWRGKGRLTKRGSPFLRKRLFASAWGTTMKKDGAFKKYYDHLRKEEGRPYVEALLIITRKLMRIMHAVALSRMPFDATMPLFVDKAAA